MASTNKLFLRIPHSMSSQYILDAIDDMKICKIKNITIKKYPRNSTAVVTITRWYKDTEDIRDNLLRGEALYIPTSGNDLIAKNFVKIQPREKVDEFGRDMHREYSQKVRERKPIDSTLSCRASDNAKAAADFIAKYGDDLDSLTRNTREKYITKKSEELNRREIEARMNYLYALHSHCDQEDQTEIVSDISDC